ncbi:5-oxoprolinase subunit C family protein [Thalassotalea agarivorans]|uniref:Biotin-dependent carboxylase uncharacterized domain-containing protein n=1 Tax=Thalassotalea agarivorans TaxID=349064 RepID=A0A1I0CXX5_THASX|nr:biotin-dependent carboxyltransferase family protein [Thalassotalea agarivorans]SET24630.1 biotin-dependent carboxylase uncharacterized domain-containing protein [Thalassotalea agarivorans]
MTQLRIDNAGMLSLIQDLGRFGQSHLGLTTGGPADKFAFVVANRLLQNDDNAAAIEVAVGGFSFTALHPMHISVTGANVQVSVNGKNVSMWQTIALSKHDQVSLGYASEGVRSYIAFSGGLSLTKSFTSVSTVPREKVGGIDGKPLKVGQLLTLGKQQAIKEQKLAEAFRPQYRSSAELRVIEGYQVEQFSAQERAKFYSETYTVSELCDRMGYRLTGAKVSHDIRQMFSEGIALGAIQIPADGQPIVLLNDRQTIGGYPKLGSVFSLDLSGLMQLATGATVSFTPITIEQAHNALHLARYRMQHLTLETIV